MSQIRNVIFDLGGVLIDWRMEVLLSFHLNEEQIEDLYRRFDVSRLTDLVDLGRSREEIYREMRFTEADKEIFRLFVENWEQGMVGPIEGTVSLLERLKKKSSYRLFSITNWSMMTFPPTKDRMPFLDYFEDIAVSGKEGIIKPDLRLYRLLLERNGLHPEDCVFIDDKEVNVRAAEETGMKGIRFCSPEQTEQDLIRLGLKIPA